MTETMNAIPGINSETLTAFAGYASENPDHVQLGTEAVAHWTGHAGHTTVKIGSWTMAGERIEKPSRDFSLQIGAWKEVEDAMGVVGADDKLEPVEVALGAMCSCVTWAICINAANAGISFDELSVSAKARLDPRVLLGEFSTDQAPDLVNDIEMQVSVKGEGLTELERAQIEEMCKRSPVHSMIAYAKPIATSVSVG